MRRISAAVSFLSRVPVSHTSAIGAKDVASGSIFFPLVGAAIGGGGVLVAQLSILLPASLTAILVVAFWAVVTGAMHLDGLSDTADGLGGGRTREDKLRIMRDPLVGSYGVVALILSLALKVTALTTLIGGGVAVPYLILAPTLGRWVTIPLGRLLPYARADNEGLGTVLTQHVRWRDVVGATATVAVITYFVVGPAGFLCWAVVAVLAGLLGGWFKRSIGGVTGDTLGAACELCETAALVVAVGLTS